MTITHQDLFPKHPPVVEGSRQTGRKPSFYDHDETLQLVLKQYLDETFFKYAEERLRKFGELCANEIDERARFTDREGELTVDFLQMVSSIALHTNILVTGHIDDRHHLFDRQLR